VASPLPVKRATPRGSPPRILPPSVKFFTRIRALKLHCTRHTWASFALEAGRNVRWVADVLGPADPALTLRVYAHAMPAEEADLSFADFALSAPESGFSDDPRRPYTAPRSDNASELVEADEEGEVETDSDLADFALRSGGGPGQNRTGHPHFQTQEEALGGG